MKRLDTAPYFMGIAHMVSMRSTCPKRQVGCVIVVNGRIVATGYNGAPSGSSHCDNVGCLLNENGKCIRAIHAEINAIAQLPYMAFGVNAIEIWTTDAPCLRCLQAISALPANKIYVRYSRNYYCEERDSFIEEVLKDCGASQHLYLGWYPALSTLQSCISSFEEPKPKE